MPRFDPDTIAALAEGRLDSERASELESAVAADPAASAELAAHRRALDAARSAPLPTLSTVERTMLRSAVASALGVEHAALDPMMTKRRRIPWAAISVAAAAFVALVSIAPLAHLLSAGEESASAPTPGAFDEFATTSATLQDATTDLGLDQAAAAAPTEATAADPTTTAGSVAGGGTSEGDEDARKRLAAAFDALDFAGAQSPTEDTPCLAAGRTYLGDSPLLTTSFAVADGITVVAFYVAGDDGTVAAAIGFDPVDCSVRVTYP